MNPREGLFKLKSFSFFILVSLKEALLSGLNELEVVFTPNSVISIMKTSVKFFSIHYVQVLKTFIHRALYLN